MPVAPLTSLLVRAKLPFLVLQGPCRTGIPSFCRRSALGLKGVAFGCHQHHVVGSRCTCALKGHSLPRHRRLPCPDLLALCADKTVCVCVCVCVCVRVCVRACVCTSRSAFAGSSGSTGPVVGEPRLILLHAQLRVHSHRNVFASGLTQHALLSHTCTRRPETRCLISFSACGVCGGGISGVGGRLPGLSSPP